MNHEKEQRRHKKYDEENKDAIRESAQKRYLENKPERDEINKLKIKIRNIFMSYYGGKVREMRRKCRKKRITLSENEKKVRRVKGQEIYRNSESYRSRRAERKVYQARYRHSTKYKKTRVALESKRKNLGFELIAKFKRNILLTPTHFHHIDDTFVIEIPAWLHIKNGAGPDVKKHRSNIRLAIQPFLDSRYYEIFIPSEFDKLRL